MTTQRTNPIFRSHALFIIAAAGTLAALAAPASAQRYQQLDGAPFADETPYDIQQTSDGGVVVVGEVSDDLGSDMYVSKHDKDGAVMWYLRYGTPERDAAYSVHQTAGGSYIVAGHTEEGPLGLALMLVDPGGLVAWAHTFRGDVFGEILLPILDDAPPQVAVRESDTGDFIAVANMRTSVGGQVGIFLRTDPGGFPIVNVAYPDFFMLEHTFAGFSDLKEAPDGSIVITGFHADAIPSPFGGITGTVDILAMRIDPLGAIGWSTRFGHPLDEHFEVGRGIDYEPVDDLILIGAGTNSGDLSGVTFNTQHLLIDGGGGGILESHLTKNMLPAYSATRFVHGIEPTTAGRDYGLGGVPGVAGAAAVVNLAPMFPPSLPAVIGLHLYGPSTPEGAHGLTPMDLTCGWAVTGPEPDPTGLGYDQWIAKANDTGDSFCFQDQPPVQDDTPPVRMLGVDYLEQFDQQWQQWGQHVSYQPQSHVLCHSRFCDCPADINGDGILNLADVTAFITAFTGGSLVADLNGDGFLNLADVTAFIAAFTAGC